MSISNPEVDQRAETDAILQEVAHSFGTPAFVYFTSPIARRAEELRAAFKGRFLLSFAVKSNPNPSLLRWLKDHVELLDISSIGEFRIALKAGWEPSRLSFTGPGKRDFELSEALEGDLGELIVESVREAVAADRIARAMGKVQDIMIRIAPSSVPKGFGDQMAGRPSPFGLDVEQLDAELPQILALPNLRLVGFHIYSGTQCLKAEAICENYRTFIGIFREAAAKFDLRPAKLVFGSGLGIPYHAGDTALDLQSVAEGIGRELDALKAEPHFADTRLVLELGRYLVGQSGYFLTRIVSVKDSRGARIGICDGGMNNHLPASGHFGMVIHRNYVMHKVGGGTDEEKVDLSGPLCTSIDRLARGAMLPRVGEGDLIAIHNSGAYGPSASPLHFISHPPPREILVENGEPRDVTWDFSI